MTREIVGYGASTIMLLTFATKDVRLLRVLAIFANIAFLTYGFLAWLPPVLCLHLVLLPINTIRLREMLQARGDLGSGFCFGHLLQNFLQGGKPAVG
jgi:hypothetical protein